MACSDSAACARAAVIASRADAVGRFERRQRGLAAPAALPATARAARVASTIDCCSERRPREQFAALVEPTRTRGLQRLDLRQQTRAAVDDHPDLRLEAGHFGVDLQHPALRLVHGIAAP